MSQDNHTIGWHGSAAPGSTSSSLLGRVKAGQPDAWGRLVELYGPTVYRWCRQCGAVAGDAADVCQEVFSSMASHVGRFRREKPGDSFRGWLWTITRNKAQDYFRRRAGEPNVQGGSQNRDFLAGLPAATSEVSRSCEPPSDRALVRRALEAIHKNSLVHRDIKPSNLMLTAGLAAASLPQSRTIAAPAMADIGQVKILDLGLARLGVEQPDSGELTSAGQAMGTADYMAPEQVFDSHKVDIRADIYSLGCTLYKLLSGHAPFSGPEYENSMKKMLAHVQTPVPPVTGPRPDVPKGLAAALDRMLAKKPDERYATPADVAAAVAPFDENSDLSRLLQKAEQSTGASGKTDRSLLGTEPYASSGVVSTDPAGSCRQAALSRTPLSLRERVGMRGIIAVALGFSAFLIFAAIITLTTRHGTLVVECHDPNVRVDVKQSGKVVDVVDVKSGWKISLKSGQYELAPQGSTDRFQIDQDSVTVRRGEVVKVKLTLKRRIADRQFLFSDPRSPTFTPSNATPPASDGSSKSIDLLADAKAWDVKPGSLLNPASLVLKPADIKGLRSWTLEIRGSRGRGGAGQLSPDDQLYATGGHDGVTRFLDPATGKLRFALVNPELDLTALTWSPDNVYVAVVVRIWNVAKGTLVIGPRSSSSNEISSLAWSPDAARLAIARRRESAVIVCDLREARQTAALEEQDDANCSVNYVGWSADGKQLLVTTDLAVRIRDVAGARLVQTLDPRSPQDQSVRLAAAWSPDGKRIATLCNDRKVKVFDSTGKAVMSGDFGYAGDSLPAIAWSPDGCHVAGSWYAGSSVLNAATGGLRECNTVDFVRWSDRGMALSWSKDSARVFSTHVTGTVIAMNLRSRKPLWQLTGRAPGLDSTDICISPDGRQYATAVAYDRLYTWDAMQGALAYDYGLVFPPWDHVAWSNDGRLAVAGRGRIWETGGRVWDPGEPGPPHFCRDEGFGCAAWSPDGKTLARGGRDLFLWTADSGDPHPVFHSEAKVTNLAWGANGSTLAAGLDNNKVLILETPSGKVLQTLGRAEFEGGIRYLAVLPDGRLVAASHNGVVSVWNSKWETVGALARLTKTVRQGGDMVRADIDVNNGATSAGGTTIALATSDGIVLWDADKQAVGKTVGTGPMYSVAWSLPLHRLFADQGDRLVIYDEPSGELLASQVIWWGPGKHLLLSPEGHMRCSPAMSEDVVYVALTDDGRQLTLRPNEFAAKYGWRNDPDKIRLSSGAAADEKHGGPAEKAPGAATAPPSPSAPETLPLNRLVDILPKVDLERDTVSGAWTKNDAGVASTVWGSSIMLPVEVDGDYDLIVMFTRHRSNHYGSKTCPCVIFPVAAKKCALVLSEGDQFTGLEMIDGNSAGSGPATTRDKMLVNEQRYNVHLKVRLRERLGTIGVLLDQDPYLHWQGDVASLDIPPRFAMPRPRAIGLAAGCLATFHSVQLRLVSGKASWATSAKPPGPAFPPGPQHEREVAEWVLSVGGGLDIETADGSVQRNVKSLPSLPFWVSALCLRKPEIHDCDLRRLRGLERLKMINLSASTTDETLKVLSDLPTLENVTLWWRANTDEGLKRLGRLKKLKFLGFEGSQLTDDALASFSDLEDADFLQFGRTFIKGPGLVHLAKMSKMTRLWLYCTPIDDAGLAHLPELKGLTAIRLSETKVSDAGLKELYRLPALRELYVEKTEVTGKGLFRLHEALPACTFYADPPAMEEYHTLLLGKGPEKIGLHK